MREDTERRIKEWFKDHKATYTQHGDMMVLDWRRPGTIFYYVRYVFDGLKLYVSGDMGEAVFWFTERAELNSIAGYNVHYFDEKLRAFSGERKDFDSDQAVKAIQEWVNELDDDERYDIEDMGALFACAKGCNTCREWAESVREHSDFISEVDPDYWEWVYKIGDEIPSRVQAYWIGLKMAAAQLKEMPE